MNKKQFLILPYVNFEQDFKFEDFSIWKNTSQNWKEYLGFDNTSFLKRFVDQEGKLIRNIYVVTSNFPDVPYQKWERLIHTLFFIVYPTYTSRFPNISADDFDFEVWDTFSTTGGYTKFDKFTKTIVSPGVKEKIYPDQFVNVGSNLNFNTNSDGFKFFEDQFRKDYNSNILRSISYFFKTQYKNDAHFSMFDDVVNYCSAFQTYLDVQETKNLGIVIAERLACQFSIPETTKSEIRSWMIDFYTMRSRYTHGDKLDYADLIYKNMRHIDIAGQVFQVLLSKEYMSDPIVQIDSSFIRLFESQIIFDDFVKLLTRNKAKEYLLSCDELKEVSDLFMDVHLDVDPKIIHYENKNNLKQALKTLLYVFEHLCSEYLDNPQKESEFDVEPLKKIRELKDVSFPEEVIDKIAGITTHLRGSINSKKEIRLRDKIPLSTIFDSFGKLRSVYKGYNRF